MSLPGLSWDAMLKKTGIWLELITDIDMQFFIEKGMRGGISYIAHRYGKANNKYMKDYNPKEESSYLMMLITFMVGLCHSPSLMEISNGSI